MRNKLEKLSMLEIAGILATYGDIHLVADNDDIHFYKTPKYHEGDSVTDVHRVHCSARAEFDATPYYVTFKDAVDEIMASKCDKYYTRTAVWYPGYDGVWKKFTVKK